MSRQRPLRGTCSCGRNQYVVQVPEAASEVAQIFSDNSTTSRRFQAAPLTLWLRVPLSWYHSTTFAFYPDETHTSIRRTYTSPFTSNTRQNCFCGYCGTQLSSWNEESREHADFISLTLGSLIDEDLNALEELGLLPTHADEDIGSETQPERSVTSNVTRATRQDVVRRGVPWFETMVEDSQLGRIRRQKGGHTTSDGKMTIEWEVVEVNNGIHQGTSQETLPGKRKLEHVEGRGAVSTNEDVEMKGAL